MQKSLKSLIIFGGICAAVIAATWVTTALAVEIASSAQVAASEARGSGPLNHGKGYASTHTVSQTMNHHNDFTGIHAITQTVVASVVANSPVAAAGLKAGDVIVAIDSKAIASHKDLPNAVNAKKPGDTLKLDVRGADGTTKSVSVTLGASPNNAAQAYLGVNVGHGSKGGGKGWQHGQMGHAGQDGFGNHAGSGDLTISSVQANSPAAKAGLQAGDVINQVNGTSLTDSAALKTTLASLKPGTTVTLKVLRNGQPQTVTATLGESQSKKGVPYLGVTFGRGTHRAPKTQPGAANSVG